MPGENFGHAGATCTQVGVVIFGIRICGRRHQGRQGCVQVIQPEMSSVAAIDIAHFFSPRFPQVTSAAATNKFSVLQVFRI